MQAYNIRNCVKCIWYTLLGDGYAPKTEHVVLHASSIKRRVLAQFPEFLSAGFQSIISTGNGFNNPHIYSQYRESSHTLSIRLLANSSHMHIHAAVYRSNTVILFLLDIWWHCAAGKVACTRLLSQIVRRYRHMIVHTCKLSGQWQGDNFRCDRYMIIPLHSYGGYDH